MKGCIVNGCDKAVHSDGLCDIHVMQKDWADNTDINNLGIVKFSQFLLPHRINKKFGVPMMHKEIYSDLLNAALHGENKMDRLHCIAAPREHSKSTIICFVFVLYCILFQKKKYIVIITESYDKATQYIRSIKKALASKPVQYYFGNISTATLDKGDAKKWTEGHILTSTGVTILALGAGKSARGLVEDTRPDLIIADDIESENNTKTEESRSATWKWWTAQVVPACDMINGQAIYIGTMVHFDCTLAKLMEQDNGYRKRFYQVYTDHTGTATIWPEKFPLALVKRIEAQYRNDPTQGVALFYMEYLNIANNPEEKQFTINKKDFLYIKNKAGQFIYDKKEEKHYNVLTYIGVDPASSIKKTAKHTGIVVGAMDFHERLWILESLEVRVPIVNDEELHRTGAIETVCELIDTWRPEIVGWEVDGVGRPIYQLLKTVLAETDPKTGLVKRDVRLRGIDAPKDEGKVDKIRNNIEPMAHRGKLIIQETDKLLATALEQFPKTRHMDVLDALTNVKLIARPPDTTIPYEELEDLQFKHFYREPETTTIDWELPR
jgi:hypothetical protein